MEDVLLDDGDDCVDPGDFASAMYAGAPEHLSSDAAEGVVTVDDDADGGEAADDDSDVALYHGENTGDGSHNDDDDDSDVALYHGEALGEEEDGDGEAEISDEGKKQDEADDDDDDFKDASENHHDDSFEAGVAAASRGKGAETASDGEQSAELSGGASDAGESGEDEGGSSRVRSPSVGGSDGNGSGSGSSAVVVDPPSPVLSCSTNPSEGDLRAISDLLAAATEEFEKLSAAASEEPSSFDDLRSELRKVRRELESAALRQRKLEMENSALKRDLTKARERIERKSRHLACKEEEVSELSRDGGAIREELAKELDGRGSLVSGISQENGRMIRKLRDLRDEKEELEAKLEGLMMRLGACTCGCALAKDEWDENKATGKLAGRIRGTHNLAFKGTIDKASKHSRGGGSSKSRSVETPNTAVDIWQSMRSIAPADLSDEAANTRPSRRHERQTRRGPSSGASSLSSSQAGNESRLEKPTGSVRNSASGGGGGIFQSMRRISIDLATEEIEGQPDPEALLPNVSTQSRHRAAGRQRQQQRRQQPQRSRNRISARSSRNDGGGSGSHSTGGGGGGGIFESMRSLSVDLRTEKVENIPAESRPKSRPRQNRTKATSEGNASDGNGSASGGGSIFQSMRNLSVDLMDEADATPVSAATVRAASSYTGGRRGSSGGRSWRSRDNSGTNTSAPPPAELPAMEGERSLHRNGKSTRGSTRHRPAASSGGGGGIFESMRSLVSVDMLSGEADSTLEAVSREYHPARRHVDSRPSRHRVASGHDPRRPSVKPSGAVQLLEKMTKGSSGSKGGKSQSIRSLPTHLTVSKRHLFNKSGVRGGAGAKEPYISASTRLLRPETVPGVGGPSVEVDFPTSGGSGGRSRREMREDIYGRGEGGIAESSGSARSSNGLWATTSTRLFSGMADEVGA